MLSDEEAAALGGWVLAADQWAHASQAMVGAANELATVSRDIAAAIERGRWGNGWTADDLRRLAIELERDTAVMRDAYMATAANIEQYRDVL